MKTKPTVFVVDDDQAMRDSLSWLLESAHMQVKTFDSAQAFLDVYESDQTGCALVDVRMPGMSGLELHRAMDRAGIILPVIIITGHGDIAMAVNAMKAGAFDFVEKPFDDKKLLERIAAAIAFDADVRRQLVDINEIRRRMALLSPREHEAMELVVQGHMNKQIGQAMGVTEKTVESHRAAVMRKMEASTVVELVRMALAVDTDFNRGLTHQTKATSIS